MPSQLLNPCSLDKLTFETLEAGIKCQMSPLLLLGELQDAARRVVSRPSQHLETEFDSANQPQQNNATVEQSMASCPRNLKGAWMLYKAVEGYTGAYLNSISRGKSTLYIVPVQGTLDTSPLPYSAKEFAKMPKATCQTCGDNMPVQLLAAHVASCETMTLSTDLDEQTACPICEQFYPRDFVEIHASFCGESIADVIKSLSERMDETSIFSICITRDQMLERGLKQWQRQKKSSPKNPLRVSFIGEAGVDNGALRKEFLTEMMTGIEKRFFEGGENGKTPKYSMTDIDKHNFKTSGEIFSVSITQVGPPPNFFMEWCYNYISFTPTLHPTHKKKNSFSLFIPSLASLYLFKQCLRLGIKAADHTTLMECTDRILLCGYTGAVSIERKEDIMRSVVLHATVRLLPMLQRVCSGTKLYGLLTLVQQDTDICRQLFVPGSFTKVDADFLVKTLSPVLSENGTMRRQRESRVVNFLQDFVQDVEDEEEGKNNTEEMPEEETKDENDKEARNISGSPINVARDKGPGTEYTLRTTQPRPDSLEMTPKESTLCMESATLLH
ncbi:hypothetical protein G5714_004091 [Onychostoma macrolepis]|uniref:HECT domain-containing protein n=1 Tax=Onychostoma macrolepis TaxID=369639 RepID=A0A7J6DBG5_9TELE|nr:hypothetical protein G5714_004091 [Onychostoma macrolepis]